MGKDVPPTWTWSIAKWRTKAPMRPLMAVVAMVPKEFSQPSRNVGFAMV